MNVEELRTEVMGWMAMIALWEKQSREIRDFNHPNNLRSQQPTEPVHGSPMWRYFYDLFD